MGRPPPDLGSEPLCLCSSFPFQRLGSHPSPGAQGFLLMRILPVDRLSRFCLWTNKKHLEGWDILFLSSISFTKAENGPKMSYRELKFCGAVLLTEGWNRREENPRTFSPKEGDEKEVQQVYKHKAISFSSVSCCKCLLLAVIFIVVSFLGQEAVVNSLNVY